jgi:hypothetical protein
MWFISGLNLTREKFAETKVALVKFNGSAPWDFFSSFEFRFFLHALNFPDPVMKGKRK